MPKIKPLNISDYSKFDQNFNHDKELENIIIKLKNRSVKYNNVNKRLAKALNTPGDTIHLPTVALKIMGSAPTM